MAECSCTFDSDGQCHSCRNTLTRFVVDIAKAQVLAMRQMMERLKETAARINKTCKPCSLKYLDGAIAVCVKELDRDELKYTEEDFLAALNIWIGTMFEHGVTAIPLTIKAWTEVCARHKFDPKIL